jgi:carboxymethylenebutenolidase
VDTVKGQTHVTYEGIGMAELNDMQRYLVHEFIEDYEDGLLSRRDMLRRVLHITGGVGAAVAVLTSLGVKTASAQDATPAASPTANGPRSPRSVPEDDPSVIGEMITFDSGGASIMAYEARPAGVGTPMSDAAALPPLILICHENRGLNVHIEDVARRLATQGYVACAVDLLSREGGTAAIADPSQIPAILTEGDPTRHVVDFQAAIEHYQGQEGVDASKVGMIGFCLGGGITWRTATLTPELNAGVSFYGPPPPLDAVPNITAAMLGVYSDDPQDFANEGMAELEAALEAAGVTFQINIYPNTQHQFHNDTGQRYNEEQALAAWDDTLAWFEQYVKGAGT